MPPRRSTRSARASLEPTPAPAAAVSKRKRTDEEVVNDEKENAVKPASRTRKPSVGRTAAPSAKNRSSSSRVNTSLDEVPETDGEQELSPPPVKKARPSPIVDVSADEDDLVAGEEVKPRSRKAAPKKQAAVRKTSRVPTMVDVTSEEDEAPKKPARASRAASVKASAPARSARGSAKSKASKVEAEEVEVKAEEEEEIAPKGRRVASRATGNGRAASRSVAEETADTTSELPARPERKNKPHAPSKKPSSTRLPPSDESEEDDVPVAQLPAANHAGPSRPPPPAVILEEDDEEDEVAAQLSHDLDAPSDGEAGEDGPTDNASFLPPPAHEEVERSLLDPPVLPVPRAQPVVEEPTGPRSRLVIHKMALVNFKSYAGRQEIGPFHKSFSAIVGPNGSGKSNTIDALLFVFGYRASKMRQGKLSELIHNSATFDDLDFCSVEVHFREIVDLPGPDAFEVVPDSQLVVARTAYKNNSSKYTINGQQSNFTEVTTLLKGRGIDLDHKRFLILQGEVESIALMKPKAPSEHEDGLLEYLEDIIGTSRYKEPIEEALVEMDRLSEDRVEKLNRLKIVEREKNQLEEQKKEAEDFLRLQNEHIRALSRLWQYYLWKCLVNEEVYTNKIAGVEKELEDERERNKDDITHLELLEKHYEERGKAYEEVKAAAAEALKDLATHEKEEVGLEERRKHAKSKQKKLKKTLQEDEQAKVQADRAIEDNTKKAEKEKAKVDDLEASLEKEEKLLEEIRDSLKDKTQVFHDKIEIKQKELQPWMAKINAEQASVDIAKSERDTLAKKAEAIKAASQEAREALEKLQQDHEAKEASLQETTNEQATAQRELRAAEKKLQEIQARVQELRNKASSKRQKADEAKSSQSAASSQNKVLDSLTRLKTTGRITGFHGRLGSLGTIPDKYDVAVSTACGALHNLVVDTVEQGQACIEYLRKQNVGRASFMVLEKLNANHGMAPIAAPENVPRLFDLIKPKDPRFAPAFYKGVGNTLVAEDLEQANRIAFGSQKRWRVVTLAGQLIDSSGTMSGGGTSVNKGGMSSKLAADAVSPEVLRKYEEESEEATGMLDAALQELRGMEAEVERLTRVGPQLDVALEKITLDIQTGQRRVAEAQKRVKELKSQSKPDAADVARIGTLDEDIASSVAELEELREKSQAIEKAIKALEDKILEVGGAKLLTQKSKVEGIRLHITLGNDEITKAEVQKAKAEKDTRKLEASIATNSATLEEMDAELEELTGQWEECKTYVAEIRSKVEAAQQAAENSKDDLEGLKAELDAKTEEIQAFRQKEMELQQSLADTRKEAADNNKHLEHWQTEHDKLKLEEIDEDDDEEEEAHQAANPTEGADGADAQVKADPDAPQKKGKGREHTPSFELHIYGVDELATFKKRELIADAELLDEKLKNAKPNLAVLKEYRKREEEFLRRAKDLEDTTGQRDAQKQIYDGLRKQRLDEFMAGFSLISLKLKEMYQMITLGGNAELELVDSMDPFSEGIIFSVMPPKKSWKNISNLSGGEKTLSSLALVFALHVFKPTPLYFMDEIDAALDFRNVSIIANYIKDRTKNAQFIIISLRNDMFELSHRLIGIYKTANTTKSVSINNHPLSAVPQNAVRS